MNPTKRYVSHPVDVPRKRVGAIQVKVTPYTGNAVYR